MFYIFFRLRTQQRCVFYVLYIFGRRTQRFVSMFYIFLDVGLKKKWFVFFAVELSALSSISYVFF